MDSIYYNFNSIRYNTDTGINCQFDPSGPSWIGEKMLSQPNGFHIFFNSTKDSIFINTLAEINNSWVFYRYPNGNFIEATCNSKDTFSFSGIQDSVKTFALQEKDSAGNQITSSINNKDIRLSKNSGLIKFFEWYGFPADSTQYIITHEGMHKKFELYNYEPGDEFEYEMHYLGSMGQYLSPPIYYLHTVLDKNIFVTTDSISYQISRKEWWPSSQPPYTWTLTKNDTVYWLFTDLQAPVFNTMPGESLIDSIQAKTAYSMQLVTYFDSEKVVMFTSTNDDYLYFNPVDSCYENLFNSNYFSQDVVGIGNVYGKAYNQDGWEKFLLYIKKGNNIWGNKIIPLGNEENFFLKETFLIYPNPSREFFSVYGNFSFPATIKLFDIFGNEVLRKNIYDENQKVKVDKLCSGIYSFRFTDAQGRLFFGKQMIIK